MITIILAMLAGISLGIIINDEVKHLKGEK